MMERNSIDLEKGIVRLGGVRLSADTTAAELEALSRDPDQGVRRRQDWLYSFDGVICAGGVAMRVYCSLRDGRVEGIDLNPVKEKKGQGYFEAAELEEDYDLSCRFLEALMGCTCKKFDWGTIETYLYPDYHDSYHGGAVYMTYRR